VNRDPKRLLQLSDLHLRADPQGFLRGVVTLDSLRDCWAEAQTAGPYDAVLLSGDLVQDEPAGYAHLQHLFAQATMPVLCIPGNHDDPVALEQAFDSPPFQTLGCLRLDPWVIVALDSTQPGRDSGALSDEELTRLDETLTRFGDRPALIALHHPPVALGSRWIDALGLQEAERFWAVIDRHANVRCVVFGHAHQTHQSIRNGICVLGAPATSAQFLPASDDFAIDDRPPGWRVISLHADGRLSTDVGWLTLPSAS
jgi:3',5'-cyclic-AMP phosphodiesterase